jgi:CMP-N-acetylneuraminic acid synthetase
MNLNLLDKIKQNIVYAIIPARSGSKGVKNKNILDLGGFPLIAYSIAAAKLTKGISRVIVSTDSAEYAVIARKYGAETPFLRPAELAGDKATDYEFMKHTIDWLSQNEGKLPEFFVHLRPTSPMREPKHIEKAITAIVNESMATSLRSAHKSNYCPYKWFIKDDNEFFVPLIENMTLDEANNSRQDFPMVYVPDAYVDILKTEYIIKHDKVHGDKMIAFESPEKTVDIDFKEDYDVLKEKIEKSQPPVYNYLKSMLL